MSYLEQKNQELKKLAEDAEKGIQQYIENLNKEINSKWKNISQKSIEDSLKDLGFNFSREIDNKHNLWISQRDNKSIIIPKDITKEVQKPSSDGNNPKPKKKKKIVGFTGIGIILLTILYFLLKLGILGEFGKELVNSGNSMLSDRSSDVSKFVYIIGSILGISLIVLGFIFIGAQHTYNIYNYANLAYSITAPVVRFCSDTIKDISSNFSSYNYDTYEIDRQADRIKQEMTNKLQQHIIEIQKSFNEKIHSIELKENELKNHYTTILKSQYNL